MTTRRVVTSIVLLIVIAIGVLAAPVLRLWWGGAPQEEAQRIIGMTGIGPGSVVAEIGAGSGEMAEAVAARVLPNGRMYVTEVSDSSLTDLAALRARHGWNHFDVRRGEASATGLPDQCCDVLYMRHVFHHLDDPAAMSVALRRATRSGGHIVVIDFDPIWLLGVIAPITQNTGGHGVTARDVTRHLQSAGFNVVRDDSDWTAGSYMVMFRAR